ncbi:MAG: hypothetical protein C0454_08780 [Parvibaculum sp.]|jgi:hypothetical protein|nr:hypothetical protein [Parvibaculum sp.]
MSFVLRAAFWLTVLAFLLPGAGEEGASKSAALEGGFTSASYESAAGGNDIGAGEALTLAARSAQDVMGFCSRNPDVCEKSHAIAGHVMRQTTYYGSLAIVWLTEKAKERQQDGTTDETGQRFVARPPAAPDFMTGA